MAEEFEKLSAKWKACEKKMQNIWGALDSAAQTTKNTQDWLQGAHEDIVERVFAARKSGVEGKKLSDFLQVGDVKSAWAEINKTLKTLEKAHNEYQAGAAGFAPLYKEAAAIKSTADSEVAARKKKKLVKSKSIPDLEKLAKEIGATLTQTSRKHMSSVEDFARKKSTPFTYDKKVEKWIADDIAGGINSIKVTADKETEIRELAPRHLAVVGKKLEGMAKEATGHCVAALKAHKASDSRAASTAFDKAFNIAKQVQKISKEYEAKLKKNDQLVKQSADGAEILKRMNGISTQVRDILLQVQKTQKALAQSATG